MTHPPHSAVPDWFTMKDWARINQEHWLIAVIRERVRTINLHRLRTTQGIRAVVERDIAGRRDDHRESPDGHKGCCRGVSNDCVVPSRAEGKFRFLNISALHIFLFISFLRPFLDRSCSCRTTSDIRPLRDLEAGGHPLLAE